MVAMDAVGRGQRGGRGLASWSTTVWGSAVGLENGGQGGGLRSHSSDKCL